MNPQTARLNSNALQSYSGFSEVRVLLHRLQSLRGQSPIRSVAVLSEGIGEGKSFVCAVLASGLGSAEGNRRVLIVDAAPEFDRREPLLESLADPIEYVDVIRLDAWKRPEPSAPASTSPEHKLKELLDRLGGMYEWILVDTPALVRKNRHNFDPLILASLCDGAVVVSSGASVKTSEYKRQGAELGVKFLGVIHNERPAAPAPKRKGGRE